MTKLTRRMQSQGYITYGQIWGVPLVGRQKTLWTQLDSVVRAVQAVLENFETFIKQLRELNEIKEKAIGKIKSLEGKLSRINDQYITINKENEQLKDT